MPTEVELFGIALGLSRPWEMKRVEFSSESGELHLYIDFARGSEFACAECGSASKAYDTDADREWRHLNFFQYPTFIHARIPRVTCATCGVRTVEVPWARPGGLGGDVILAIGGGHLAKISKVRMLAKCPAVARTGARAKLSIWRWLHNAIPQSEAEAAYQVIRASKTDVAPIARYTRYKPQNLQRIKDYLFNNPEWTGADPEIAAAWHRLRTGRHTQADRLLLKHETAEMLLRNRYGRGHWQAHRRANRKWNWQRIIEESAR